MHWAEMMAPAFRSLSQDTVAIGVNGAAGMPGWIIDDLCASGIVGDARSADAERGARLLDSAAEKSARLLVEFAGFDHRRKR